MDWIAAPSRFSENLSAYLWATHQIDDFSRAAEDYIRAFNTAMPEAAAPAAAARLGGGCKRDQRRRTIRSFASCVLTASTSAMSTRAAVISSYWIRLPRAARRIPPLMAIGALTAGSRQRHRAARSHPWAMIRLKPVRKALIRKMQQISASQAGVEAMRTRLAETVPSEVGLKRRTDDPVLSRFAISVLSEGSGTQIYSTTFVQWTAREALRRARPLTLLARFAPRQTEESADEELSGIQQRRFSTRQDRWSMRIWAPITPGSICSGSPAPGNLPLSPGLKGIRKQSRLAHRSCPAPNLMTT